MNCNVIGIHLMADITQRAAIPICKDSEIADGVGIHLDKIVGIGINGLVIVLDLAFRPLRQAPDDLLPAVGPAQCISMVFIGEHNVFFRPVLTDGNIVRTVAVLPVFLRHITLQLEGNVSVRILSDGRVGRPGLPDGQVFQIFRDGNVGQVVFHLHVIEIRIAVVQPQAVVFVACVMGEQRLVDLVAHDLAVRCASAHRPSRPRNR